MRWRRPAPRWVETVRTYTRASATVRRRLPTPFRATPRPDARRRLSAMTRPGRRLRHRLMRKSADKQSRQAAVQVLRTLKPPPEGMVYDSNGRLRRLLSCGRCGKKLLDLPGHELRVHYIHKWMGRSIHRDGQYWTISSMPRRRFGSLAAARAAVSGPSDHSVRSVRGGLPTLGKRR